MVERSTRDDRFAAAIKAANEAVDCTLMLMDDIPAPEGLHGIWWSAFDAVFKETNQETADDRP